MPDVAAEVLAAVPLYLLLAIAAIAVAVAERRSRRARAAAGRPCPATERYAAGPALAVARREATRVARHPLLWLGVAGAGVVVTGYARGSGGVTDLLTPVFAPLFLGLFAAIHLAVGRDRHAGMEELSRTLPVGARARTVAHLLAAAWVGVPIGLMALATAAALLGSGRDFGDWSPGPLELFQPAAAVLIVAALAVAAGRWWRHAAAGFLVPLLLFFSPFLWGTALYMDAGPKTVWQSDEYLGTITATHLAWHWVFLGGYLVLAVTGALLRHDRRRILLAVAGVGVAAMVVGYVVKLPSWWWQA